MGYEVSALQPGTTCAGHVGELGSPRAAHWGGCHQQKSAVAGTTALLVYEQFPCDLFLLQVDGLLRLEFQTVIFTCMLILPNSSEAEIGAISVHKNKTQFLFLLEYPVQCLEMHE